MNAEQSPLSTQHASELQDVVSVRSVFFKRFPFYNCCNFDWRRAYLLKFLFSLFQVAASRNNCVEIFDGVLGTGMVTQPSGHRRENSLEGRYVIQVLEDTVCNSES